MLFRRSLIGRSQSAGKQSYLDWVLRGGLHALEVELTFRSKPPWLAPEFRQCGSADQWAGRILRRVRRLCVQASAEPHRLHRAVVVIGGLVQPAGNGSPNEADVSLALIKRLHAVLWGQHSDF